MNHPLRLLFSIPAILLTVAVGVNAQGKEDSSVMPTTTTVAPAVSTTTPPTTVVPVTTTVVTLPEGFSLPTLPLTVPCQELADEALAGGWPWELLPEVLSEAYSESRCQNVTENSPEFNGTDHGPMQINMRVHKDYAIMVLGSEEAINIPVNNFKFAWKLYSDLDEKGICGFKPWTRPCKKH
jgi:hypothetical protein